MDAATDPRSLRPADYCLLILLCAALAAPALLDGRWLTTHEATHCLNVREMFDSGQFGIPTYGGRPWLERPPVPHWLTGIPAAIVADCSTTWAMRVGSILAGMVSVLVVGWAVAGCFGRHFGLMSAAVLATFREFAAYSVGPEADIFLATFVTLAGALFLRSEFGPNGGRPERATFFGTRPWSVLGVFIVLGATNAMKGPLFGTAFLASSLGVYFVAGRHWASLRRYVWLWGWLAYFAVGCLWPLFGYSRHPDIVDLWFNDYGKRLNEGYVGEPAWYYAVHLPWNLFPWTFPALVGLCVTCRFVFSERNQPWQFLWAWALVPPVLLSAFQGKHHHYLLNCVAPWAPIAVAGSIWLWRQALTWPTQLRSPLFGLVDPADTRWSTVRSPLFGLVILGLPGTAAAFLLSKKIPGPEWVAYTAAIGWPFVAASGWYFAMHRNGRVAFTGFIGVILVVNTAAYLHRTAYMDSYAGDRAFLAEVDQKVPAETPIYVLNEWHPLNAAWPLYYLGPRAHLLHHITFLSSDRLTAPEVYVIGRRYDEAALTGYGAVERIAESPKTRAESSPMDRYTLYRLRFFADLVRYPEPPVNGMEATGRSMGPVLLGPEQFKSNER
jgi:4-amino-4-deoxy-L-arabinose transferase-like glycosyltransferase